MVKTIYIRKPPFPEHPGMGGLDYPRASQSLLPQEQINGIIFSGDMRVGENTSRLANVRTQRVRCSEPLSPQTNPSTKWGLFDYPLPHHLGMSSLSVTVSRVA